MIVIHTIIVDIDDTDDSDKKQMHPLLPQIQGIVEIWMFTSSNIVVYSHILIHLNIKYTL